MLSFFFLFVGPKFLVSPTYFSRPGAVAPENVVLTIMFVFQKVKRDLDLSLTKTAIDKT